MILESVYDSRFSDDSYGFRSAARAHDARDAVYMAITTKSVIYVFDADIVGCFDNINRNILIEILKDAVGDTPILRLIKKLRNVGVLDKGDLSIWLDGVVQGSTLAHIFLDYVLDKLIVLWSKEFAKRGVYYARLHFLIPIQRGCSLKVLTDRLLCDCFRLHSKKTRLIAFRKYARLNIGNNDEVDTETFNFLGLTNKCGITFRSHKFKIVRNCISESITKKLFAQDEKLKIVTRLPFQRLINWLNSVLQGYYTYFAVPDKLEPLSHFRHASIKLIFRRLKSLSQRCKWNWEKFNAIFAKLLIFPKQRPLTFLYA